MASTVPNLLGLASAAGSSELRRVPGRVLYEVAKGRQPTDRGVWDDLDYATEKELQH